MSESRLGPVDLSTLPLPDALDPLDWLTIVDQVKAKLVELYPACADVIDDQMEPLVYLCQNFAARELQLRAEWNDKVRSVLLPTAMGADLENIGAGWNVPRAVLTPADGNTPAVMEDIERYRRRVQLAPEAFATTGSREAYEFHTLSAHPQVLDCAIYNYTETADKPGTVRVVVLASAPEYDEEVLFAVKDRLFRKDIRPLTDNVSIQSAHRVPFNLSATLRLPSGPSAALVRSNALAALGKYLTSVKRIGYAATMSGLYGALHVPGVERVDMRAPVQNVEPGLFSVLVPGTIDVSTDQKVPNG